MARSQPRDQEALAFMVRALRAYAGGSARNNVERDATARLRAAGVTQGTAGRLAGNFDRLTPALRRRALGTFETGTAAPSPRTPPAAPARPVPGGAAIVFPRGTLGNPATAAPGREVAVDPSRPPGTPVTQYTMDYAGFHCDRERGDFGWSDEVYAITSTVSIIGPDGSNNVRTEKHPNDRLEYGDVDFGETRLGPVARVWQGNEFPVSLTVVAFERDHGDPNVYRDEVDDIVKTSIATLSAFYPAAGVPLLLLELWSGWITDGINWFLDTDDDQVDIARTQVFDQWALEAMGRDGTRRHIHHFNVMGTEHAVRTELDSHFFSRHSGGGGRYVFGFNLGRTPAFVEDETIVE